MKSPGRDYSVPCLSHCFWPDPTDNILLIDDTLTG